MSRFCRVAAHKHPLQRLREKADSFCRGFGQRRGVPTEQFGIAEHEPTPSEALKAGSDLVCF